ncbi:MAG: TetR family transcriptional regulator [Sphingobium sp.]|nr:TetR family transcriptional regulator [Sphingobium sp.]MCC4254781.1 TetR/AcrR family transcriptional regulator; helix-turn-helix transcriptional regulator [Sphingobium naphthae]
MNAPADRTAIRNAEANITIVDAARMVIAERGLAGMSMRTVAEQADMSVGSISYRIGDRAALVAAVIDREMALADVAAQKFLARLDGIEPVMAGLLPDLVGAWLDLLAGEQRISAIVTCELALFASRMPETVPDVPRLLDRSAAMWRTMLQASPDGDRLADAIHAYCLDERPFSIALGDMADYRLLRQSTIRALLRNPGEAPAPAASQWHMALVDRLAGPSAEALYAADIIPQGAKAALADHIADLIIADGVGALSHRAVAQASGMAASSVAHHFPTHRDIVFGGVEAIYRRMRVDIRASNGTAPGSGTIIQLTHESALLANRNPAFLPFAIDMRRRRAENVHMQVAQWIGVPVDSDRARVQAIVIALIGHGLEILVRGALAEPFVDMSRYFSGYEHSS